jgi:hypothetical protein
VDKALRGKLRCRAALSSCVVELRCRAVRSSCAVELRGRAALPSFVQLSCAAKRTGCQTTSSRTAADNLVVENLADNLAHISQASSCRHPRLSHQVVPRTSAAGLRARERALQSGDLPTTLGGC